MQATLVVGLDPDIPGSRISAHCDENADKPYVIVNLEGK